MSFEAPLPACLGHVCKMVAVIRGHPCAHANTDKKVAWQSPVRADEGREPVSIESPSGEHDEGHVSFIVD